MKPDLKNLGYSDINTLIQNLDRLYIDAPAAVVDFFRSLSREEQQRYPELAVFAGRYLVDRDEFEPARQAFRFALDSYQAVHNYFGMNRVRIFIATLAFNQADLLYCRQVVDEIIENSKDLSHLMASWQLRGKVHQVEGETDEAAQAYQTALNYANRAELSLDFPADRRRLVVLDRLNILQHLADLYSECEMLDIAQQYQTQAVELARLMETDSPRHTIWVLMRQSELRERRGDLVEAMVCCEDAERLAQKYDHLDRWSELQILKGRLLCKLGHDKRAEEIFDVSIILKPTAHKKFLLEKARNQIYRSNLSGAAHLLKQARLLPKANPVLTYQIKLLEVAILCMEGDLHGSPYRAELEDAIRFFEERHMLVELSETKLVLAWALVVERRTKDARDYLAGCVDDCTALGHVTHIWRWYVLSLKRLIKTWYLVDSDFVREQMEMLCRDAPAMPLFDESIRVHGFGRPQWLVGDENHFKQIRYDSKHIPLLMMFMLEGEYQTLDQITHTIWTENEQSNAADSFHALRRSNLVGDLITYESQQGIYRLNLETITYADMWHFRDLLEQAYHERDPAVRMLLYRTALMISENPLANGIEHPYIHDQRTRFDYDRARAIQTVIRLKSRLREEMAETRISDKWMQELDEATLSFGVIKPIP